jgi:hypothetical protein
MIARSESTMLITRWTLGMIAPLIFTLLPLQMILSIDHLNEQLNGAHHSGLTRTGILYAVRCDEKQQYATILSD